MSDPYPQTVIAILLLLLNALFALGGESFKTLNKAILNRKAEDGDKTALKLPLFWKNPICSEPPFPREEPCVR